MTLACLSGHTSAPRTLRSVPAGADRAVEFVALEEALRLAVGWDRGRVARRLGLPPHQVRRWRMRGEALLAGRDPSPDSREPALWVVMAMRGMVALAWFASTVPSLDAWRRDGQRQLALGMWPC